MNMSQPEPSVSGGDLLDENDEVVAGCKILLVGDG
jgi:hypothetical protein